MKLNYTRIVPLLVLALCVSFNAVASGQSDDSQGAPRTDDQSEKLVVWHVLHGDQEAIVDAVVEEFQRRHPNVTIEATSRGLAADKQATMAALNAGTAADIVVANNGETSMGPMVRAGHLVDLDPYSEKWGWERDYLSPDLWDRAKYTDDGRTFGQGSLYGLAGFGELVAVYYNRELFDELGLAIPQTMEEFEAVCETLKSNGVTPIAYGAAEMWPFYHLYGEVLGATLTERMGSDQAQQWLQDVVILNEPSRSFTEQAVIDAAATLQRWGNDGYFFDNFTGIKIDDALQLFLAGRAGMFVQGSWYAITVGNASFPTGIFPLPGPTAGDMAPQVGGMMTPLGINVHSDNVDLAAEFLNVFISSEEVHEIQKELGMLPPNIPADLTGVPEDALYHDLLSLWNDMNAQNRVGQYLDWTSPGMGDVLGSAGQDLLSNAITPEEFARRVEAEYRDWVTSK